MPACLQFLSMGHVLTLILILGTDVDLPDSLECCPGKRTCPDSNPNSTHLWLLALNGAQSKGYVITAFHTQSTHYSVLDKGHVLTAILAPQRCSCQLAHNCVLCREHVLTPNLILQMCICRHTNNTVLGKGHVLTPILILQMCICRHTNNTVLGKGHVLTQILILQMCICRHANNTVLGKGHVLTPILTLHT